MKQKNYLVCVGCGKKDETVHEIFCGYSEEIHDEKIKEIICEDCEHEHLMGI